MLRCLFTRQNYVLRSGLQTRHINSTCRLLNKKEDKTTLGTEEDWEQANVKQSSIANNAIPQHASSAIPSSMLAAFNNMFDRGPNVGIEVITKKGFVLSNHIKIDQPLILLNGSPFLWNAPPRAPGFLPMKDWDIEAFKIFELVSPRPELIMFGTGREFAPIPEHIRQYFFKLGIQVDQMNSVSRGKDACQVAVNANERTFNRNMQQPLITCWQRREEELQQLYYHLTNKYICTVFTKLRLDHDSLLLLFGRFHHVNTAVVG